MEKYFGEKQERFSFRKLSVGLVSATISSLFFMSVLGSSSVEAQETKGVHYKYVTESELSSDEKKQLVYDIPTYMENDDETYYLVYKLNSQNQLGELPNTGSKNDIKTLVAGASLAALGILIFAVSKKKVKNKTVLHLVLVAGIGNGVLVSAHALENNLLLNYNTDYELTTGEKLPLPKEISGYTYIGYIKEGKTTSDFEVSNQEKSAATPTKQQKVDYNVTPNFVDHPSTVQAIQEQTPVSSTKPTEVQVVEKPFSTELINPRKEEKQSSDSQEQLAEHKNLETKKEEKISPKEKTGVNTLNPQDEVLSGQLNKPELLYREETIETKIDFQEEIQENPDLAEGTVRVKQEGKLGKKVEIVRIFSVNKEEVSREIVSTSTTAPSPRIVEKGTKKTQVIKEQPETGVEHKDVQSGAIVEPAIQPELPEAVVSDKGEPEVQPALPEAVVTDKGEPAVQPELPEAVVTDKGETEVQPALPEAVVSDKGEPEQVAPLPEYTRPQAGAVVEPAVQPELPEAVVTDKGETEVQPESPDTVVSDKGEPKQVAPLPEYTGPQASAIVEPEQVAPLPEYTGVQAGSIVEPEKVEAPKEYTGKIEQPSAEDTKPENEASSTNGESERPKDKIKEVAHAQQTYLDFWSRLALPSVRDQLLKSQNRVPTPVWDNQNYHNVEGVNRMGYDKNNKPIAPIRELYGPTWRYHTTNWYMGAMASIFQDPNNNDQVYFMGTNMISPFGISAFTHETTHVNDRMLYFGGHRHRQGTDVEAYAQGMLQTPDKSGNGEYGALGLNMAYHRENDGDQWYNYDPDKLKTREDIDRYMRNYNDALMMLDHLEADAVIPKLHGNISRWFKKMDRQYRKNGELHQFDKVRELTEDEKKKIVINNIDDLVNNNLMTKHGAPSDRIYNPEDFDSAYVNINMMTGIYGGNTSQGAPGAASFKHNTFRMWGYFGYENGFISYASSKYQGEADKTNKKLLGDDFIIKKVSKDKFNNLEEWKKQYFKDVKSKAEKGFTAIEIDGRQITNYAQLKTLFAEAVQKDIDGMSDPKIKDHFKNTVDLKSKVFKALLKNTDGFFNKLFKEDI